jgi:dTDP-4-dehydrorhamnose 3,5-epimerase
MKLYPLGIEGAWLAESDIWTDNRGNFSEWFKHKEILSKTGIDFNVQQANISKSAKGVIRGIHFSNAPQGQAKWVKCMSGAILDVIVDVRPASRTFREHISVELTAGDGRSLLIDYALGHGFVSLEDDSIVGYLTSSEFNPKQEVGFNPFDPALKIDWQIERLGGLRATLSEKDLSAPTLQDLLASKNIN